MAEGSQPTDMFLPVLIFILRRYYPQLLDQHLWIKWYWIWYESEFYGDDCWWQWDSLWCWLMWFLWRW